MSAPATLATVYCTDEDLAVRAPQDFAQFAPKSLKLAAGTDGIFASGSPWILTSGSVSFATAGVGSNNVVQLVKTGTFDPPGELFAVDSVSAGTATLRRLGLGLNIGQPPAPSAGLTGVSFRIYTFAPQIDNASYDCNKIFGIDPNITARTPGYLYDLRELQQFVVLTVLRRLYIAADKQAAGDFDLKLGLVTEELADVKSRLVVHWGAVAAGNPPNSVMSCRTRR